MKDTFFPLAEHAFDRLQGGEVLLANFSAEVTDFVRFNRGQVRQPMTVRQARLQLALIEGRRRSEVSMTLTGMPAQDRDLVADAL